MSHLGKTVAEISLQVHHAKSPLLLLLLHFCHWQLRLGMMFRMKPSLLTWCNICVTRIRKEEGHLFGVLAS